MRNRSLLGVAFGLMFFTASQASAALDYTINWNVASSSDESIIALGDYSNVGLIEVDASNSLVDFTWTAFATIDSATDTVSLTSVERDASDNLVAVDLFAFNSSNDSVSLTTSGQVSNLFSFTAGGVSASGTYSLIANPEPSAAVLFAVGMVVATRRRPTA